MFRYREYVFISAKKWKLVLESVKNEISSGSFKKRIKVGTTDKCPC